MAREIRTLIIDIEISDEGSYLPGEIPPTHSEEELLKILETGCVANGASVAEVIPKSSLPRSYSEILYELVQQ